MSFLRRGYQAALANIAGVQAVDRANGVTNSVLAGNVFRLTVDDTGVFWCEYGARAPSG